MNNSKLLFSLLIIIFFIFLLPSLVTAGDLIWTEKTYKVSGTRGAYNQYDWYVKGRVRGYYYIGNGLFVSSLHSTEASSKIWWDPYTYIKPSRVKVLARAYFQGRLVDYDIAETSTYTYIQVRLTNYDVADKIQTKSYAHMVYGGLYWYVPTIFDEWDVWIDWSRLTLW